MNETLILLSNIPAMTGYLGVIGWAGVVATPIAMFKLSKLDGKNPFLWTAITIVFTALAVIVLKGGVFSGPIGFCASFASMWAYNLLRPNYY